MLTFCLLMIETNGIIKLNKNMLELCPLVILKKLRKTYEKDIKENNFVCLCCRDKPWAYFLFGLQCCVR